MFVNLDNALSKAPGTLRRFSVFELHPLQLTAWIEAIWETWRRIGQKNANAPTPVQPAIGVVNLAGRRVTSFAQPLLSALDVNPSYEIGGVPLGNLVSTGAIRALNALLENPNGSLPPLRPWHHLMYAYLIENTRVVEIVQRILQDALHDETFGALGEQSHRWLRATEDLFFRDGPSGFIHSITSWVRSDLRASRRNAYWRMFAMDLNHGNADGSAYPYVKAQVANSDFVRTLESLLRELWRGFQNSTNVSGPTATDPGAINELVERLQLMLNARRLSVGTNNAINLAREELVFVSMMSWFHLTVGAGSPIVDDLRASGPTPEDRLLRLGERVKLPAHGKARSFFVLAEHLPLLLTMIEEGQFTGTNQSNQVLLYQVPGPIRDSVLQVVTHWSIASGRDLKSVPVAATPPTVR